MSKTPQHAHDFSLGYYAGDRRVGSIAIVNRRGGDTAISKIAVEPESDLDKELKPVFIGLTERSQVILLDPASKEIQIRDTFPIDAFPAHIYSDPTSNRDWFMNDGDKETGNDRLNCGDKGSSVTVVEGTASSQATFLKTLCVGRGHHQAAFTYPSDAAPGVPRRAYISNLKDGTLTAVGNDPEDAGAFLEVVDTINLCEPDKEEDLSEPAVPNKAFPHGLAYSPLTGKLYNLNNGYGTIAVIDPATNEIEQRIAFKGHSNLFITPDGRYIIGRGADRKSDPGHVVARLTVLDLQDNSITDSVQLQDIYISKYYFNDDGSKLYLTTSSSGSPEQQANLKADALLVFDMGALPELRQLKELRLGSPSGSLAFLKDDGTDLVFSSNSEDGSVVVIDGQTDEVVEAIPVTDGLGHSRIWTLRQAGQ